jgi:hypothetical protein
MKWLGLATLLLAAATLGQQPDDAWTVFRPLVGHWSGVGSGFGSASDVTHSWDFVLHGQLLRLTTKSTVRVET